MFTVVNEFLKASQNWSEETYVEFDGKEFSFSEIYQKSKKVSNLLNHLVSSKGARIGYLLGKSEVQIEIIWSILMSNSILVPILPALKLTNIEHIVRDCEMEIIITTEKNKKILEGHLKDVSLLTIDGNDSIFDMIKNLGSLVSEVHFESNPDDLAAIIYSSGSTGRPKGIMITHRNLWDGALIVSKYLSLQKDDRIACILPFNFDYGLNQLWCSVVTGAKLCLYEYLLPKDCHQFIFNSKVSVLPLMPALISRLFDPRFFREDSQNYSNSVRLICSSGGRLTDEMLENLKKTYSKAEIYPMYGLTEAFRSTYLTPEKLDEKKGSIGKAIPSVEIYVVDENDRFCEPYEVGELVHRGGCISKGYWNNEASTLIRFRKHAHFPGETLLYSGDLVYKDNEGYIFFVGRNDEMMKRDGIRISPTEIELATTQHPDVLEAVAFQNNLGDNREEIVLCYTSSAESPSSETNIKAFLRVNLPRHMIPDKLILFEKFRVTGNEGKIDRAWVKSEAI